MMSNGHCPSNKQIHSWQVSMNKYTKIQGIIREIQNQGYIQTFVDKKQYLCL